MMFEVTTLKSIMSKNTNIAGQPVICHLLSFIPRQIVDPVYQSTKVTGIIRR